MCSIPPPSIPSITPLVQAVLKTSSGVARLGLCTLIRLAGGGGIYMLVVVVG